MPEPSNLPIIITASATHAGQRLDKFLGSQIPSITRSRLKTLILEGALQRNNTPTTNVSAPVHTGDIFHLTLPEPTPATPQAETISLPILYEDQYLIIINKPAGLVTHPAPGHQTGTLVNALIAHCGPSLTGIGGERRPGIVHRLDKDTSGLMVVAKTEPTHTALSTAFATRNITRSYLALTWGIPNPPAGAITGLIGRDPRDRKRMAVVTKNGKIAVTNYKLITPYGAAAALISCQLATGRTHQIRVHLASIGHPLIGDPTYLRRRPAAANNLPEPARTTALDFPRQALHAQTLGFPHPITGAKLLFTAPPPTDFTTLTHVIETGLS